MISEMDGIVTVDGDMSLCLQAAGIINISWIRLRRTEPVPFRCSGETSRDVNVRTVFPFVANVFIVCFVSET